MVGVMRGPLVFEKVNVVLIEKANQLTGGDLVRITEMAKEAGAAIHVSVQTWQIVLIVPTMQLKQLSENLFGMGYHAVKVNRALDQGFALQTSEKKKQGLTIEA